MRDPVSLPPVVPAGRVRFNIIWFAVLSRDKPALVLENAVFSAPPDFNWQYTAQKIICNPSGPKSCAPKWIRTGFSTKMLGEMANLVVPASEVLRFSDY